MKGMKKKGRRSGTAMRAEQIAIVALILVAFVAPTSSVMPAPNLEVIPNSTRSGVPVTIIGTNFGANAAVTLSSTCQGFKISVSNVTGKYAYSLVDFNISQENVSFSLSLREVQNDTEIKVKRFWWTPYWTISNDSTHKLGFIFTYDPTTNTSNVTRGMPIPAGVYTAVTATGTAVKVNTSSFVQNVTMNCTVTKKLTANATGGFKEVIDTHGIPPRGNCTIKATSATGTAEATLNLSLKCDANMDGDVGAYDCVCIGRYVVGIPGYDNSTLNYPAMDVNEDGKVDIDDARDLAMCLVGVESKQGLCPGCC